MGARYIVGEDWGHIFSGRRQSEVRFVLDRESETLVAAQIAVASGHRDASSIETEDLLDSLINGNPDLVDDPQAYGLEETDTLPDWAGTPAPRL